MTPDSLLLLLRETGDEIPSGPVRSVRAIAAEADRRRRFRWVAASAATTATAAAVAVLVVVPQLVAPSPPAPEPVLPLLPPSPAPLPADSPCPRAAGTDGEHQLVVVESSCNLSFYADAGRKLTYPALSPTGATVAFVTYEAGDAQLKVRDLTSGEDRVLATSSDTIGDPVWSPDGEMLAFWLNDGGGHPQVHVVQASGGGVAAVSAPGVNAAFPAWSPDGTAIAYSWQKTVVVVDLDTGSERSLEQAPVRVSSPFWASTDSRVLYVLQSSPGAPTERFRVMQLDAETGATQQTSDWIDGQSTDGVSDAFGLHVAALAGGRDPATTITTLDNNLEIVATRAIPGVHLYNVPPRPEPVETRSQAPGQSSPTSTCPPGQSKENPETIESVPVGPDYPVNENGMTYGSAVGPGKGPDLISAIGDCGYIGYIYDKDLNPPGPKSAEEARELQAEQDANPPVYPVYESDGTTQIDTFTLSVSQSVDTR